ncbi:thioesterase II family protein [Streptomyces physcomitrii]|uniref:Thioesterase n=1 Tax=Streptomyces physcomitrii TaxID=2724184 RepID=A0ABX1H3D8_9ACTN|nr:alpha/beta fold hydrolase [Streptomyces physcomitrii]NKI41865.1 thioesterase [Streptomyces physcomitrii]
MSPAAAARLTRPAPLADPAVRVFLIHHGGGSHLLYRGWAARFPADWEVCLPDYPGRAHRRAEPLLGDSAALVDDLRAQLADWWDRPFVLFGHSMGALLAYELTRRLLAEGDPLPRALHLSAFQPPSRFRPYEPPRHLLGEEELRDWLRATGACPPRLLDDAAVWARFGPLLRGDFAVVDGWRPDAGAPPLPVPLSVSGGLDDPLVDPGELSAWAEYTKDFRGTHLYPGGHFYLTEHRKSIVQTVTAPAL